MIYATAGRQRLRLLTAGLESDANGVVIIDRKGNVEWVNPAFLKLSGYSAAELLDNKLRLLESFLRLQPFYKVMRQYIIAGRVWHGEITSQHKDGNQYAWEITITPVRDETGKIADFIAIIQDITSRKQAEYEMLEAREAVAQAERLSALGIIAAGIAHEINQPLNSLKVVADGMLYWHRKGRVPAISEAMESIAEISKDADRIDMIIKHMRSFINNSEPEVSVCCDINRAIEESLLLLGSQLLSHKITVRTSFAAKLPPIMGNSIQLEQIVINLLINAMYALDTVDRPGKEILVSTGWRKRKNKVFLSVRDNGPGIEKAIKDKIFDPFFTTKTAGAGMGIGLSIVYSIVTAYDGRIKVTDNNPASGGVTFWIEFPGAGSVGGEEDTI